MRLRWPLIVLALALGVASQASILDAQRVKETTLPNGLHVIVLHQPYWGVVAVGLDVRCGSVRDPVGQSGISHLLEHLLFEATDSSPHGLGVAVEDLGGYIDAETLRDFMSVQMLVASSQFEPCLSLLARRVTDATFEPDAVAREKKIVLREITDRGTDAEGMVTEALWATALGKHPYGRPIGGTSQSLAGITAADVAAQYHKFYVPNNSALIIVGDVDPDQALQAAAKDFGAWKRAAVDWKPPALAPPMTELKSKVLNSGGGASIFVMGFSAPGIDRPADVCAMDLIYAFFNEGDQSWLDSVLVGQKKLALGTDADFLTQRYPGLFTIAAVSTQSKELEARQAILDEIRQLRTKPLSDAVLQRLKDLVYSQYAFSNETYMDQVGSIGFYEMIANYKIAFDYIDMVNKVTPADIQAVARRYLDPDAHAVVILRPRPRGGQEAALPWE